MAGYNAARPGLQWDIGTGIASPSEDVIQVYTGDTLALTVSAAQVVDIPTASKLSYAGTAITATAAELNKVCDVSARLVDCTASTLAVTAALHANKIVTLNRAGGIAVTLPEATGTGNKYTFYVGTTFTTDGTIKVTTTDTMVGGLGIATDIAGVTVQAGGTDDTITLNGGTTGGVVGSVIHCTDIADTLWLVEGQLVSTSTEADPFSATVS